MLGCSDQQYIEMGEVRGRRREARAPPPPITPQGLGAAPQGLGAAPPLSPTGWRPAPTWPTQQSPADQSMSPVIGGDSIGRGLGCASGPVMPGLDDGDNSRLRSASSDARGRVGGGGSSRVAGGDRRSRCSSATRSRQQRSRLTPHSGPTSLSPPISPQRMGGHDAHQAYSPSPGSPPPMETVTATPVGGRLSNSQDESSREQLGNGGGTYGYQVGNLEALLTQASPSQPANLPMVLASATRLHNMRITTDTAAVQTSQQPRPFLPFGVIVNAVFKTRDWLYVRTAHGAEGYVPYRVCLPLGILPLPPPRTMQIETTISSNTEIGVWESRGDMFPGGVLGPEMTGTTRGRTRGRNHHRRQTVDSSNHTDSQKLRSGTPGTPIIPSSGQLLATNILSRNGADLRTQRESLNPPLIISRNGTDSRTQRESLDPPQITSDILV